MAELKVWAFEEEWYVAESAQDAEAARIESTGPCDEYEDDHPEEMPGETLMPCCFDGRLDIPEQVPASAIRETSPGRFRVELTAQEWASINGRGYLMGTNW